MKLKSLSIRIYILHEHSVSSFCFWLSVSFFKKMVFERWGPRVIYTFSIPLPIYNGPSVDLPTHPNSSLLCYSSNVIQYLKSQCFLDSVTYTIYLLQLNYATRHICKETEVRRGRQSNQNSACDTYEHCGYTFPECNCSVLASCCTWYLSIVLYSTNV